MQGFAELLDRLSYEPRRNGKLALMEAYFRNTPDPERGHALAALTDALVFENAKPGLIRALIAERTDPVLFALSRDYVGDLSETVALMWPVKPRPEARGLMGHNAPPEESPLLSEVIEGLRTTGKAGLAGQLADWLDHLDEVGRWALLKLITGALRVGVSARLAKTAVARLGAVPVDRVEEVWHGLSPPYEPLFAWLEGRGEMPESDDPAPFRPPMLAHPTDLDELAREDPAEFAAEWKWDGIRIQIAAGPAASGRRVVRLYSRSGEEIGAAFPDVCEAVDFDGAVDGELLIMRGGAVQPFNVLQQRLNRKTVSAKLLRDFPPGVRLYDLLAEGDEDLRALPFAERRRRLEAFAQKLDPMFDVSPPVAFASWDDVAAARANPTTAGAGVDAAAVEGVMLKRLDSPYLAGRPKGPWFKWKRDPFVIDAVMMYAQRGSGKRSSFYSDYTFGVWDETGALVPVGKAYFGFTDAELLEIDKFVRNNTAARFGPVREVVHEADKGLVLEIAFEGLQRSTRHRSGVAMRFPRVSRLRWDKPPREADHLSELKRLLKAETRPKADPAQGAFAFEF